MAHDEMQDDQTYEPERRAACERARGCPGWLVTRAGFVELCKACAVLMDESDSLLSARAAGLDVRGNGFVIGVPGVGRVPSAPRSSAYRATASANDVLVGVLEQLQDVLRLDRLPQALRGSVDYLAIEVAKVQGVSEWIAEDIVRLVDEDEHGGSDSPS